MSYRHSATPYWLVGGLAAALIVLALLQYRWSGQISEAERARMRTSLQSAGSQFKTDFARDVSALCTGFQMDPETVERRDWDHLARQSSEWLRSAPDSGMVSGAYLWQADSDLLTRLNSARKRFEAAPDPAGLARPLQQSREQAVDNHPGRPFRFMNWTLDTRSLAILHPFYEYPEPGQRSRPRLIALFALQLDQAFLQQKFFPELANRHFAAPDGLLYNVAILTAEDPGHPVYHSDGYNSVNLAAADLNVPLIEGRSRGAPDRAFGGFGFGGMGGGPGDRSEPDHGGFGRDRDHGRFGNRSAPMPPVTLASDGHAPWRLVARHRSGSVDVAVAQARWRDLAVSFAILMLLGASMGLIVVNTQRAQRLARLQMEFVAGVSHELRTPLAVISSASQNLSDGIVDGRTQVKLYGTLIRNESRRLTGMMEQILQFASGQKKRAYEPQPIAPADLIENALALAATLIQEAGVAVERHIAPDLPNIMGESSALMQCLHNLIANAIKYGGEEKWLGIRASADQDYVRISVEDRGIGIDAVDLPHIFDAFYRSRAVSTAQIHGTGLGLSLARNFAQEAGGSISVESTVGAGSCFTVKLPVARAAIPELAERTA